MPIPVKRLQDPFAEVRRTLVLLGVPILMGILIEGSLAARGTEVEFPPFMFRLELRLPLVYDHAAHRVLCHVLPN